MGAKERALQAQKETKEMEKRGVVFKHYSKTAIPVKKKVGRPKKIIMESSSSESEEEKPKPKNKVGRLKKETHKN